MQQELDFLREHGNSSATRSALLSALHQKDKVIRHCVAMTRKTAVEFRALKEDFRLGAEAKRDVARSVL